MQRREWPLGPTIAARRPAQLAASLAIVVLLAAACGSADLDATAEGTDGAAVQSGESGESAVRGPQATDRSSDGGTNSGGATGGDGGGSEGSSGDTNGGDGGGSEGGSSDTDGGANGGSGEGTSGDGGGSSGSGPGAGGDRQLGSVLLLGDSITEGLPHAYRYPLWAGLTEAGYEFDFIGRWSSPGWESATPAVGGRSFDEDHDGTTGAWVADVRTNLDDFLTEGASPDLVLLHTGTNDIAAGSRPLRSEVEAIVDGIVAANADATILLALIIPAFGEPEANELIDRYNDDLASIAQSRPSVTTVDMNTGFEVEANYEDELHPSALGAGEIAARWHEAIDRVNGHQ